MNALSTLGGFASPVGKSDGSDVADGSGAGRSSQKLTKATKPKLPMTGKSGAYIQFGLQELQLYASIGRDSLICVLEIDTDCSDRVFTYFMRGGISDSAMTADEFRIAGAAMQDLFDIAQQLWPRKLKGDV